LTHESLEEIAAMNQTPVEDAFSFKQKGWVRLVAYPLRGICCGGMRFFVNGHEKNKKFVVPTVSLIFWYEKFGAHLA